MLLLPGVWGRIRAEEMSFILLSCASLPTVLLPECFCSMSLCILRCLGRGFEQRRAPALSWLCIPQSCYSQHIEFFCFLLFWAFPPACCKPKAEKVKLFHPGGSVLVQEAQTEQPLHLWSPVGFLLQALTPWSCREKETSVGKVSHPCKHGSAGF